MRKNQNPLNKIPCLLKHFPAAQTIKISRQSNLLFRKQYPLECNQSQAKYTGLTTETLRNNGHMHDFKTQKEKPVALPASTHNLELDDFYTAKALRSFPKTKCNSSMSRRWKLAHQATKASAIQFNQIKK